MHHVSTGMLDQVYQFALDKVEVFELDYSRYFEYEHLMSLTRLLNSLGFFIL